MFFLCYSLHQQIFDPIVKYSWIDILMNRINWEFINITSDHWSLIFLGLNTYQSRVYEIISQSDFQLSVL